MRAIPYATVNPLPGVETDDYWLTILELANSAARLSISMGVRPSMNFNKSVKSPLSTNTKILCEFRMPSNKVARIM